MTAQGTSVSAAGPISGGAIVRSAAWRVLEITGTELSSFLFMLRGSAFSRLLITVSWPRQACSWQLRRPLCFEAFRTRAIQRQELTSQHLDAAFWANLGLAIVIASLMIALAGPAARVTAKPGTRRIRAGTLAPLVILFACAAI